MPREFDLCIASFSLQYTTVEGTVLVLFVCAFLPLSLLRRCCFFFVSRPSAVSRHVAVMEGNVEVIAHTNPSEVDRLDEDASAECDVPQLSAHIACPALLSPLALCRLDEWGWTPPQSATCRGFLHTLFAPLCCLLLRSVSSLFSALLARASWTFLFPGRLQKQLHCISAMGVC